MSQWIRWWGLGLFLAIVLLLGLGTNPLIEWSIESAGTRAAGAKVELDSVDLDLDPVTLELGRLQVTNRKAPMRNLMEAERIEFALDGYALLKRRFVAENMAVEGLRFDTERTSSGAVEKRKKAGDKDKSGFDIASALPGVELPDPERMAAEQAEQLRSKVNELDSEAEQIQQQWAERIQQLPDRETVNGYRQRWNQLKDKDPLSRATGVRTLKSDIDDDLDTVRRLDQQLKKDRQRLAELSSRARKLPAEEADRLMSASGLDQGFQGVTRKLMGEKLNGWVETGLTGYRLVSKHLAGRKAQKKETRPRDEGEYIRFPEDEPRPRFLIKRASVDGEAKMAASTLDFSGTALDITTEPALWGKPMTVRVDGTGEGGASLEADATFDHREQPGRDDVQFSIRKLTLKDARLSGSAELPIVLNKGRADIDGTLTVTGGELDASIQTRIEQASFTAGSEDANATVQRLARAIEGVSRFRLDLGLSGTLSSPKISLNSDLDRVIGQALGDEARREIAEARKELENKLRAEVAPRLDKLAGREQALQQYREKIDQRHEALNNIRP